jgi:2-oxoglutarate ferredoxin oxidoreductase subunit alpha
MAFCLMEGNEAVARGAVAAGCRFFAGYPITPATSILNHMLSLLPPQGGTCLQGEDEIASIGYCLGASMAGMKVLTATSGPGISLYSEHISFAIGSEIPIVIVDVQRLGPSTGSATRGADGDIYFLRWGNSGGLPLIVLAPVDVLDCYVLTVQAFNLAERFRCPVMIASNKEIATTRESVDPADLKPPEILQRSMAQTGETFRPFHVAAGRLVPDFLPIGADCPVRQTSSTHGPDGYITTEPTEIATGLNRIQKKVESCVDQFSYYETHGDSGSDTLMIVYGVTARAAKAALREAHPGAASLLILKTLWPVPAGVIRKAARNARRILVVEMNMGQYRREIERLLPNKTIRWLGRMDGCLITPTQIKEALADD